MTTSEIAKELNKNKWYQKRDGTPITPFQIHGRTKNYSHIFRRKGSSVSLIDDFPKNMEELKHSKKKESSKKLASNGKSEKLVSVNVNISKKQIVFKHNVSKKPLWQKSWNKILEKWIFAHENYMKKSIDDCSFYYNERASLSILSAAVWLADGIAIEEFVSEKKARKKYTGRTDLWLKLDSYKTIIESKQCFRTINNKNVTSISKIIKKKMDSAIKDTKKSTFDGYHGTSIVFFSPSYNKKKPIDFESILEGVKQSNFDFFAYVTTPIEILSDDRKRVFPAGFIIGKRNINKRKNKNTK